MKKPDFTLWGSELSPFYLKVQACLRYCNLNIHYQPQDGGYFKSLSFQLNVTTIQLGLKKITWPKMSTLDELPLVPYMFDEHNNAFYDSTAFAHWIDQQKGCINKNLATFEDRALGFVVALIDEYADEFGLYMVHHMRWKTSAKSNSAGKRLALEFKTLLGPFKGLLSKAFPIRQVKRLPYLLSCAPDDFFISNLDKALQPPNRVGFPATHSLLEDAFDRLLSSLESILSQREYLLGGRFTLADASLFGQLGMNLSDPCAAEHIQQTAPNTYRWLLAIQAGDFPKTRDERLTLDATIKPLLNEIQRVFIPLMKQNETAYDMYYQQGQRVFNETAFNRHEALYNGELDGRPFRAVAKSFQVASWRELITRWTLLSKVEREKISAIAPLDIQAYEL